MIPLLLILIPLAAIAQPLPPLASGAIADEPTVRLSWYPSPSPLVAGYRIHRGVASGAYTYTTNAGTNLVLSVPLVPACTNYFAATAYDTNGLESDYSNELLVPSGALAPPALRSRMLVSVYFDWSTNGTAWVTGSVPAHAILSGVPPSAMIRPRATIANIPEVEP
jgi:hypothetical protein